ncbi:MAG TPA: GNAT family N-acetyltransferase [Anaerolineales bacterium]|nr:GNAT family N-acetyltransferase [Anaerolineales bacterium]
MEGRPDWRPIVDAAMRQLTETGWMHNRARMIAASYLVKDLLIDWRWGEAWFMENLLDGDLVANNGGGQWTAGTGTDAAAYFRIFNPVVQSMKFDPNGEYIRKWVAKLRSIVSKMIHAPWDQSQRVSRTSHRRTQPGNDPDGIPAVQAKIGANVNKVDAHIRILDRKDIPEIAAAFEELGWKKPASQYERYLMEQALKTREMYVAFLNGMFSGYLTICWQSSYAPFHGKNIPEIMDFNVLPKYRRMGIGTQLMDKAELEIAKVSLVAGIGVGMTPDYGAAQRLYMLRGYVPDGMGLYYRGHHVQHGETVTTDDSLALYLTKELK